jgi:hypothetical protein
MPIKLSTTVNKIPLIVNSTNVTLIKEFYEYLKNTGASEKHINNNLKAIMNFANYIAIPNVCLPIAKPPFEPF